MIEILLKQEFREKVRHSSKNIIIKISEFSLEDIYKHRAYLWHYFLLFFLVSNICEITFVKQKTLLKFLLSCAP